MRKVYAIIDRVTNEILGGLQLHKADAPAIRVFQDAATREGTMINAHLTDFELVQLAEIDDDNDLTPVKRTVLDGPTLHTSLTINAEAKKQ